MPGTGVSCIWTNPLNCFSPVVNGAVSSAAPAAWDAICKSFVAAASSVLKAFADAFTSVPDVNPASAGISSVYGMTLALSAVVAVLLIFGQIIRTALTASGDGLAQALTGGAKAVVAWLATAAVVTAALAATDSATRWVIEQSFGSQVNLAVRLGDIVNWSKVLPANGQTTVGASLLLVIALIGIVLVIVLWFELLLRNAALSVLIAMSPLAAAGQMSETAKVWWQRTCSAAVQLLILKLVIALVFAVGFSMAGTSKGGVEAVLEGLLVLALAVFSWPVIARFFTFTTIQASSSGLATALGFAVGRMSAGSSGGPVSGVNPQQWSQATEQRTMASRGGVADGAAGSEGGLTAATAGAGGGSGAAGGGAAGGSAVGGSAGGGGVGAAVLVGTAWALQAAHNAGTALAGRMETTAAHAGMHGAYPYSTVGGSGGRGQRLRRSGYGQGTGGAPVNGPGAAYGDPGPQSEEGQNGPEAERTPPPPTDTVGSAAPHTPGRADPAGNPPPPSEPGEPADHGWDWNWDAPADGADEGGQE